MVKRFFTIAVLLWALCLVPAVQIVEPLVRAEASGSYDAWDDCEGERIDSVAVCYGDE